MPRDACGLLDAAPSAATSVTAATSDPPMSLHHRGADMFIICANRQVCRLSFYYIVLVAAIS
eukprot:4999498-Pleurochrysis_carterae.AAC.8